MLTAKDCTDKDHENFLLEKAKEWHSLKGKLTAAESKSWGYRPDSPDAADINCWCWLIIWAMWKAGDRA